MTRISLHGNDSGSITGNVLTSASLLFLVLASFWLWASALTVYADAYEVRFRKHVTDKNMEVKTAYEID